MKAKWLLFAGLSATMLFSCERDNAPGTGDENIVLNTDSQSLSTRLSKETSGVVGISTASQADARSKVGTELEEAVNLPLELIAQAAAPVFEGNTLQATHVDIDGNYAYVTYNTRGEKYLGAIDIFDISNVLSPVITSQAIFTGADLNAVKYADGKLYIASAVDIYDDYGVESPANLITVSTSGGKFTSDFTFTSILGNAGMDVTYANGYAITASGADGAVTVIEGSSNTQVKLQEFPEAIGITVDGNGIYVLDAQQGVVKFTGSDLTEAYSITIGDDYEQSKRTMDIHGTTLIVSEGPRGAGLYNTTDGSMVGTIEIPVLTEGIDPIEIVTNAVSSNSTHLFMANGSAGVSVAEFGDAALASTMGVLDLLGSSNFVKANNEYLFVASGLEGLQILKLNLADESSIACEDLPQYKGSAWLNVNSGEPQGYSGSLSVNGLNINDDFTYCGSLAVKEWANVNSGGTFNMKGSIVVGQYKKESGLNINDTMIIEGSMVIYGNLVLNSGAKLQFSGAGNSLTVYGNVYQNAGSSITGDYTDTEGNVKK